MYVHYLSMLRGRFSEDQAYISESINDYDSESENIFNSSEGMLFLNRGPKRA